MWQDFVIAGVQIIFAISLVPTVLHADHKPTVATSIFTAGGLYTLSLVYVSLALWFAACMSAVIGALWTILAIQRYRINTRENKTGR